MKFHQYLNGNPAMLEIWNDALSRIEAQVELAPVQKVVVNEWLTRAKARRDQLQLEGQRNMLSDEKFAELAALDTQIQEIEVALRRFG